jgi:hypothetical protein
VALHPWYVLGDPQGLERAVANLLDNAAKWSPPGGTVSVDLVDGWCESATKAQASASTTCRTSSSASTVLVRLGRCPAPASVWPS